MPTVVSCPECRRPLKVADEALGKRVKCVCGAVFAVQAAGAAAAPAADETIVVSCDGCQTTLKVPASARGRKTRCPKCGLVFAAGGTSAVAAGEPPPLPPDDAGRGAGALAPDGDEEAPTLHRTRPDEPDDDEPPQRPIARPASGGGVLVNVLVLLVVLGYVGALVPTYLGYLDSLFPEPPRQQGGGRGMMAPPPPPPPPDDGAQP